MGSREHVAQVVYVSEGVPSITGIVLDEILSKARVYNAKQDLTGFLTYDGTSFCQLLEGPKEALYTLMERIERDPRHDSIVRIWSAYGERFLPHWSMHHERFAHADEFVRDQVRVLIDRQGESGPSRGQIKQLVLRMKLESLKRR